MAAQHDPDPRTDTPDTPGTPGTPGRAPWRDRWREIIFEADTPAGKVFDVVLLVTIILSVIAVMLESMEQFDREHHESLVIAEWIFTVLFTIEYVLRLVTTRNPVRYATSFFGIVDLMAILPSFIGLLVPGAHSLLVIRALRLLRVFRVFKLVRFLSEATSLRRAIWASRAKITVFLTTVVVIVVIMGTAMHLVEGGSNAGFDSIPQSMYWAVVTMTTVGYGDATPESTAGKFIAAVMMIIGYSMIIVPTGILSAELTKAGAIGPAPTTRACPECCKHGHADDARYCKFCGAAMD